MSTANSPAERRKRRLLLNRQLKYKAGDILLTPRPGEERHWDEKAPIYSKCRLLRVVYVDPREGLAYVAVHREVSPYDNRIYTSPFWLSPERLDAFPHKLATRCMIDRVHPDWRV